MSEIPSPFQHCLSSAEGWLLLGNPAEAEAELGGIPAPWRDLASVLEVRWQIHAARTDWDQAVRCAEILVQKWPERESGWIQHAYALRRAKGGGLEKAWAALRPAFERFPKVSIIPYNLACYAAQFGRLEEAWEWLHQAMKAAGDVEMIKNMALADTDLQSLWDRLR